MLNTRTRKEGYLDLDARGRLTREDYDALRTRVEDVPPRVGDEKNLGLNDASPSCSRLSHRRCPAATKTTPAWHQSGSSSRWTRSSPIQNAGPSPSYFALSPLSATINGRATSI